MSKIILIIFLLGVSFLGYYSLVFKPNNIKIEKQVIFIKNLPPLFNGIRIVQLSDFHSWWFGSREKRVLEMLEELKPDFVFITGDFVGPITKTVTDKKLNSVKVFWQKLAEKNKIFAVLGNHDTKEVKKYLKESGIIVLDNENRKLTFNNQYIYLVGVNDPDTGRDNLEKATQGIKEEKAKILLAHGPEIIDKAVEKNMDLVLVGHTHGGQVNIPILGDLIQPLSNYGRKYKKGLFKIDSVPLDSEHLTGYTYLYVNRGVGTSIFPIRFNSPAEITLIELQKM